MGPLPPDVTPRMVFEALEWVMEDIDVVGVIIGPEHDQDWLRRPDLDGAYAEVWPRTADVAEEARQLLPGQQLFRRWAWAMPLSFVIGLEAQRDRSPTSAARGMGLGGDGGSAEELSGPAEEQAARHFELEDGATWGSSQLVRPRPMGRPADG